MIKRVKVQDYKSLKNVDVELQPLTVIFGPNAAGKSNLFDALALLSRMGTARTLREAFDDHRGAPLEAFFHGERGLEALLDEATAQFSIEVDVEISDVVARAVEARIHEMRRETPEEEPGATDGWSKAEGNGSSGAVQKQRVVERHLRYSLSVEILTGSGHLRVADERLCALNKSDGSEKKSRKPFIEKERNKLVLRMEGQSHPSYPDLWVDHTLVSTPLYPPHYPHITALREELSRWRFYYLEPKNLMRSDNPLQEASSLDPTGANLAAFYNSLRFTREQQFDTVNQTLPMLLPRIEKIAVDRTRKGELQLRVFEHGIPFSSSIVSEGTLRILGLLAITNALTPATVVGYEEPENGVHPRRLKLIADLLTNAVQATGIQFMVNTHSPYFLGFFKDEALINCRKNGSYTVFERGIKHGGMFGQQEINKGFDEDSDENNERPLTFEERILRGDFGG